VFAFLLFSVNSFSQQKSGDVKIDSTATKIPEAIPVIEINQRIEEANKAIKQGQKKIMPKPSVLKIDSLFPEYSLFIQEQKLKARAFVRANPNRQKIDNLITKWSGYYDHLDSWESKINSYEEKNILLFETIDFAEKTWALTYENAKGEDVPADMLASVKKTWDDVKKIKSSIIEENNGFLKLETKISNEKSVVNAIIEDLINLKNSEIYDLFYLRHAPLWKTSFKSPENQDEKDEKETLTKNINVTYTYLKNNENSFYLYFVLIILITILLIFLKKVFLKHVFNEENAELQRAKDLILNQNTKGIIFISLVLANEFFTNTPTLFSDILFLLTIIASIPIVRPFIYKRFKNIIYFIVLFYILDTAKTYIWFTSGQYRIYLLLEAFIVIAVLFAFTHPYLKTRVMKIGKFGLLLVRLTPVIYSLSVLSIVSNVLGYTNLTDLALKISTRSGEITIIFYGILMISGGISTGLTHYHFSTKESYDPHRKIKLELKLLQIIRVIAFIAWFLYFLDMIDLYRPLELWFADFLSTPNKVGSSTFTFGAILGFIVILSVSFILTSIISFVFDGGALKVIKLPKGVPAAISLVIRYFIIAFGFILALSSLGIDLSKFNLMAGALGLGIGFGLQTIISNFVSGLILVFERPILVGDTVEVNNLLGTVSNIGVRASNIRTFDGAEVVVPNNNLIANDLINWTLSDNVKRVEILIGTTYGSDPNKILEVLVEAANECDYTLKNPPPNALFSEFGDSSLNFKLRFWVHYEKGLQAKSDVSIGVYNKFEELGIEIPFPQQDVYIKDMPKQEAVPVLIKDAKKLDSTIQKEKSPKKKAVKSQKENEEQPADPLPTDRTDDDGDENDDGDSQN